MFSTESINNVISTLNFKFPYSAEEYGKYLFLENYHSHSSYSNIAADSPTNLVDYVPRIKELGGKCLYTMEHGWQGNVYDAYDICEREGLKIVVGSEVYWVKDRHKADRANCHMVIQAKNDEGRKDINFALSIANEDGFYYKPRIDFELLFAIPKGRVIITSACVAGWNYEDAEDCWLRVHEHFGNDFYLEVQNHDTDKQKVLNEKILRIAEREGIQIICGLDSHFIKPEDHIKRDEILKYKHIEYPEEAGWFMDYPDTKTVIERFKKQGVLSDEQILRSIMNTNVFASDEVEQIVLDRSFKIPTIYPDKTYDEKCKIYKTELNKAYKNESFKSQDKIDGIRFEAQQVIDSGVVDYFLTSQAIVKDAVENEGGILTTTARGSASSFVTNKLIGLTTVDRYTSEVPMYPERFLTKDRVLAGSMPDIDLNIGAQAPFVKASRKFLGTHGCYPLMTIKKLKEKNSWQMYASNSDVAPSVANEVSKYLDAYNKALKHADDDMKDTISLYDYLPEEYVPIFKKSKEYQNIVIGVGVHACGHLLLNGDIRREIGLISAINDTTKERTICAAIEGGYLDEFGYVKEDFLIVDSVSLTHELFAALGQKVPSLDELKKMVDNDKPTWDIYEKGIVCCVNQCEKPETRVKAMKYKPKNIGELAQFIAAIRPGFASLLTTFLDRRSYSTGEKRVDDLLSDSAHFMIYQESIMKVLQFLGLPMGETYKVIKSISKKKLKGEKLQHLLDEIRPVWIKEFGNDKNFSKVWTVIEQAAAYSFNAPHAYSMAGDSLYEAWFKAHHTALFYEVAMKHYQKKNNKDKIADLQSEAIKYYGYQLAEYKFGDDNRDISVSDTTKSIYQNISTIKGFGKKAGQALYELGQNKYNDFFEVIQAFDERPEIDKSVFEKLIRISYFSDYGDVNKLLALTELYNMIANKQSIKKDKATALNISDDVMRQFASESPKTWTKLDSNGLLKYLEANLQYEPETLKQKLDAQHDILGIIDSVVPTYNKRVYYVSGVDKKKTIVNAKLYEIYSGETREVKIWTSSYDHLPFMEKDMIRIAEITKQNKREATDEINPVTGKKIWRDIPDQYEFWLKRYSVILDGVK